MNIRTVVVATGLCVSLLIAGCASTVDGQPQIAAGAVLPTTSSAPAPFPDPSSSGTTGGDSTAPTTESTQDPDSTATDSTDSTDSSEGTENTDSSGVTDNTPTGPSSTDADDSSVFPSSVTSIPGLSKDCNAVLAGITAFSNVLEGAGSTDKISQATVDKALEQLPASGLPARPQADITVLRTTVSGAAGKTLSELVQAMTDGAAVAALKDLSSWAEDNCT